MIIDEIRENYEDLKQELKTKDMQLSELESKGNKISDESSKFLKQIKEISDKLSEEKKRGTELKKKINLFEKERTNMNTQFESMIKDKKKFELDITKKDARINKLSEDLDKMKINARGEKMVPKVNGVGDGDKGSQMLINENKKLEKQRNELLVGFKKQLKMIDL